MANDHVVIQGNDIWCRACGKRESLKLPMPVNEFARHCKEWTEGHANCAYIEKSNLVQELRRISNELLDENKRLKEAIASIPDTASYEWSQHRLRLRRAAGLED